MAPSGFRIFDSDTHVEPYMDVLSPYLSGAEKELPQARKRKLFWGNAVRLYARCGLD